MGLTLIAAYMATHYQRVSLVGPDWRRRAIALASSLSRSSTPKSFSARARTSVYQHLMSFVGMRFRLKINTVCRFLPASCSSMAVLLCGRFVALSQSRAPGDHAGLFALMPLHSIMTHWSDNEQRDHWFGYWFGHDMFTPPFKGADGKPLYPEMTKDAVLFGGTDPGTLLPDLHDFLRQFSAPQ